MIIGDRNNKRQSFEVIVIGGGAAGLSAALWCDELGLETLLLESRAELGGQLLRVYNPIKNHLGADAENGRILRDAFLRQIEERNFTVCFESEVSEIDVKSTSVFLKNGSAFSARALIIATGVRRRRLNVPGEVEFENRGILESGARERDSIAGKSVCIVGGGDAALENALILSEKAARVLLVHRRREFRARPEFIEKVATKDNVKILTETAVAKIVGGEHLESVELRNLRTEERITVPIEKMLMRIGVEPNTELLREKLELDPAGYAQISANCQTSVANVFAVGDVANPLAPTVSSAAGMGATAAKVIFDKLRREVL